MSRSAEPRSGSDTAGAARGRADFARLTFRFGFLCTRSGPAGRSGAQRALPKAGWRRRNIGAYDLWTHPEARVSVHASDACISILIGEAYDLATGAVAAPARLEIGSDDKLHDLLDGIGGRYALLVVDGERLRVFNDAIGSRSVFYNARVPFCIGSHAALVARAVGAGSLPQVEELVGTSGYRARTVKYLPGDLTLYEAVLGLIPNNCFDSASMTTSRYWRREPVARCDVQSFLRVADGYLAAQAAYAGETFRPIFGLTGGVDTRTVFASFRAFSVGFETVTWKGRFLRPEEVPVVARLSEHLGVPHRTLTMSAARPARVARIARRNAGDYRGASWLTEAMHGAYGAEPGRVFMRCWGGEILRGFYNLRQRPMRSLDPSEMVRAYGTEFSGATRAFAAEAFEGFFDRGNYAALRHLDHDQNDLFYWEHRMGMWGAMLNNELDPAMPTLIGMNSRALFLAAFGLPTEQRLTKRLLLRLTERYDPVLAGIPLAPQDRSSLVARGSEAARSAGSGWLRRVRRSLGSLARAGGA